MKSSSHSGCWSRGVQQGSGRKSVWVLVEPGSKWWLGWALSPGTRAGRRPGGPRKTSSPHGRHASGHTPVKGRRDCPTSHQGSREATAPWPDLGKRDFVWQVDSKPRAPWPLTASDHRSLSLMSISFLSVVETLAQVNHRSQLPETSGDSRPARRPG